MKGWEKHGGVDVGERTSLSDETPAMTNCTPRVETKLANAFPSEINLSRPHSRNGTETNNDRPVTVSATIPPLIRI